MKCPICKIELNKHQTSGIELITCTKCEGVWFDKGEFRNVVSNLLSTDAIREQPLKKAFRKSASSTKDFQFRNLICPRCETLLEVRNFSFDSNVFIDKCTSCNGLWTDKGELLEIAEYIRGNDELDKFANSVAKLYKDNENRFIKFFKNWQNYISGFIGAVWVLLAYLIDGSKGAWEIITFIPIPLGLIWFGDELGRITYAVIWNPPPLIKTTPGYFVKLIGWLILFSPIVVGVIIALS